MLLNYTEHLFISASAVTESVSIESLAFLVDNPKGITGSAV